MKFFQSKSNFLAMLRSPLLLALCSWLFARGFQRRAKSQEPRANWSVALVLVCLLGVAPRGLVIRFFVVGFFIFCLLFLGLLFPLRLGRGGLGCVIRRRGGVRCGRSSGARRWARLSARRRGCLRAWRWLGVGILPAIVQRDHAVQRKFDQIWIMLLTSRSGDVRAHGCPALLHHHHSAAHHAH